MMINDEPGGTTTCCESSLNKSKRRWRQMLLSDKIEFRKNQH